MLMSKGSLGIFFANSLVTCLVLAGIALLLLAARAQLARRWCKPEPVATDNVTSSQEEKVII